MQFSIFAGEVPEAAGPVDGGESPAAGKSLLGTAGQYLVAFDLAMRGHASTIAAEGLPYDVIAEIGGLRRVQVKTRRGPGALGSWAGPRAGVPGYQWGDKLYSLHRRYEGKADLFALVAMDVRRILYVTVGGASGRSSVWMPAAEMTEERCELAWAAVLREWGLG